MARPGISYQDVANAAHELSAQGKNPTIESIRAITGTGSSTTIAQHLKEWKYRQDQTKLLCSKENLPEEIVLTMKGLWERVIAQAEEKVLAIKQDFDFTIAEYKDQNMKLHEDNNQWQKQFEQLKQEKDSLSNDKSALELALRKMEDEKIAASITQENMAAQLLDKHQRIDELLHSNQQVQSNLEHYREASREQRLMDQRRYEQAQLQLEQNVHRLEQELLIMNQQKNKLAQDYERECYGKEMIQSQYNQLKDQNDVTKSQLEKSQQEIIQHSNAEKHWQDMYQKTQSKLDEQNIGFVSLQTNNAVLNQKISDAQEEMKELKEQNKFLAHEKWIVEKENAQLVGQLKQFETLKSA